MAEGNHPLTGQPFNSTSELNDPYIIRLLFHVSQALGKPSKKQTNDDKWDLKREDNLSKGKPARSHFPYDEKERSQVINKYKDGESIELIAGEFERSHLAIAVQLNNAGLISDHQLEKLRRGK